MINQREMVQTWIMKINMGFEESYVAGFLPLRIPACATLVVVEFDDIFAFPWSLTSPG